jgi:hypothetical protein
MDANCTGLITIFALIEVFHVSFFSIFAALKKQE